MFVNLEEVSVWEKFSFEWSTTINNPTELFLMSKVSVKAMKYAFLSDWKTRFFFPCVTVKHFVTTSYKN